MKKLLLVVSIVTVLSVPAVAPADFTLTNPGVTGTGSGDATGTAIISDTGPWDVPDAGGFMDTETVTPSSAAIAFQESHVEAHDGTGSVSTSVGTHTDTRVIGGNTVTATTSGSTFATVDKENNPPRALLFSEATSRLIAAGGAGTIIDNEFFNTQTGFMLADADAYAYSTGNDSADPATITDVTAGAKGSANVSYRFAGSPGPETVSIADADVSSIADINDDTTQQNLQNMGGGVVPGATATSNSYVIGKVGWTDSATLGRTFGAEAGVNAESEAEVVNDDDGPPLASAAAEGNVDVNFTYRPIANPVFSFLGNAGGSVASEAKIPEGYERPEDEGFHNDGSGVVQSSAGKNAVGVAGADSDAGPLALAWIHATVFAASTWDDNFQAAGSAEAINPAQLGTQDPQYDPSMTVGTQFGAFSAAMGSSTLTNAQVNASVAVMGEDQDRGLEEGEAVFASAFGFSVASLNNTMNGYVDADGNGDRNAGDPDLFGLSGENAFAGVGSVALADTHEDDDGLAVTGTADAVNLFGVASSPSYYGTINNGASSASVTPVFETFNNADDFEVGYYRRASSASADNVGGTNYPNALAHNQMFGLLGNENAPWWSTYAEPSDMFFSDGLFEHLAVGFIGGGGN